MKTENGVEVDEDLVNQVEKEIGNVAVALRELSQSIRMVNDSRLDEAFRYTQDAFDKFDSVWDAVVAEG